MPSVFVFDPTVNDPLSKVRGIGRYLQVLKEALPDAIFSDNLYGADKYDVLINPFINLHSLPLITKKYAVKQIIVLHDIIPQKYPEHFPTGIRGTLNLLASRHSLRNYDVFITDSEASKKDIVTILNVHERKVRVLYPALQKKFLEKKGPEPALPLLPDQPFCLYVGDATWNKNLVSLAQAVLLADVSCVVVGKVFSENKSLSHPWQDELRKFLGVTRDDPHFIFPGFVSDHELVGLYRKAFCNVLISRDEGFGYSYFEAASQGTPSVLSDIPVFRETADSAALLVNPKDSEGIADGIRTFLRDKKVHANVSRKAKLHLKKVLPSVFKKNLLTLISE